MGVLLGQERLEGQQIFEGFCVLDETRPFGSAWAHLMAHLSPFCGGILCLGQEWLNVVRLFSCLDKSWDDLIFVVPFRRDKVLCLLDSEGKRHLLPLLGQEGERKWATFLSENGVSEDELWAGKPVTVGTGEVEQRFVFEQLRYFRPKVYNPNFETVEELRAQLWAAIAPDLEGDLLPLTKSLLTKLEKASDLRTAVSSLLEAKQWGSDYPETLRLKALQPFVSLALMFARTTTEDDFDFERAVTDGKFVAIERALEDQDLLWASVTGRLLRLRAGRLDKKPAVQTLTQAYLLDNKTELAFLQAAKGRVGVVYSMRNLFGLKFALEDWEVVLGGLKYIVAGLVEEDATAEFLETKTGGRASKATMFGLKRSLVQCDIRALEGNLLVVGGSVASLNQPIEFDTNAEKSFHQHLLAGLDF